MSNEGGSSGQKDTMEMLPYKFIDAMLGVVGEVMGEEKAAQVLMGCSCAHYRMLDVDSMISGYSGRLEEFISFIESNWGWKVSYDKQKGIIDADENKAVCVCPLVQKGGIRNPMLCHCSEGFTKSMFSRVTGKPVRTEVAKSVLRGDKSCVYRIYIDG